MSTLVVAPHMDDEVLGCGGLMQRLEDVKVVFLTEVDRDVRLTKEGPVPYLGADRTLEMKVVAAALGYEPVRLKHPVHRLDRVPTSLIVAELEDHLKGVTRLLMPALSHDADHEATRRACEAIMRPHCFNGTVLEYMTWGCPDPYSTHVVFELSDHELDLKKKAMKTYATQTAPGGIVDPLYLYSPESIEVFAAAAGRYAHCHYGEAYLPRRIVDRV